MNHSLLLEKTIEPIAQELSDIRKTIYVGIAGFTILIWDHFLTIEDEIELIWKTSKGIFGYLFLLNRYLTPFVFIVNLVAYNLPTWSKTSCKHFVRYEGATTAIGIQVAGLMMLIRVCAMYKHQWAAIALAVILMLAWICVTAWLLVHGEPVRHPSSIHSCSMVFSNSGTVSSASAWLPLLYDTYVFGLTSYRTFPLIRNEGAGKVVRTLFADGLLYYSVICTVNLVLSIMLVRAADGVKNIAAQLELLLTVTMMSRITLNLKKQARRSPSVYIPQIIQLTNYTMPTALGKAHVFDRLQSHSAPARSSGDRMRSSSASSTPPPARPITFAENSSFPIPRPLLTPILSATNTPEMSLISDNLIHINLLQDEQNTIDIV